MSDQIIFHHYPESPVSEKVRVVFGIKGLAWRSVHIPRVPPRPELFPMTGGYRRTPVMQIGADIYCDSDCIVRELQRRQRQVQPDANSRGQAVRRRRLRLQRGRPVRGRKVQAGRNAPLRRRQPLHERRLRFCQGLCSH